MNLVFLGNSEEARKAYAFCGAKSGRDFDKAKEAHLTPVATENGCVTFDEARLTLTCRKLYKTQIRPDLTQWYGEKGGLHDVYVVEILDAYKK